MYTEVGQIIRASQVGDKQKAASYARLLAENLTKDGKEREARMVLRALGDLPPGNPVTLDSSEDWAMMQVHEGGGLFRRYPDCPKQVPMRLLNEQWAQRVHMQSLKRLNERGGMCPTEIMANIYKVEPTTLKEETAIADLKAILRALPV